jgi:hypothetical protein
MWHLEEVLAVEESLVEFQQIQEPEILPRFFQLSEVLASPRGRVCHLCSYQNA